MFHRSPQMPRRKALSIAGVFDHLVVERDSHSIESTTFGAAGTALQDGAMATHPVRPATLTGARIRLRAPHVDDADAMFGGLASDPEVTRYLSWIPHRGVGETRRVITKLFNVGLDPTGGFARGPTGNLRYCQDLWMRLFQATSVSVDSPVSAGVMSTGRSRSLPLWNTAPARTRATRCGALTARQRACAASMSL
jgi:hypothetical protein